MRIIFFGTPKIAVPTLEHLISHADIKVVGAVSQPDRAAGRGHKLHSPPVKMICEKNGIPVFQPAKLSKAPDVVESMRQLEPDLIVMVAFGQILKKEVLSLPKYGVINLHASLLPAYRGAAPINWAIINGDTTTGITTMFTEAGLDTGPILLKEEIELDKTINAQELTDIMAERGAKLTIKTIETLMQGTLRAQAQENDKATYAPILDKAMGNINWQQPALNIHNLVRGLIPWPGAFTSFRGNLLKIWRTELLSEAHELTLEKCEMEGSIRVIEHELLVSCGDKTWLKVKELQPMNKPKMAAKDWINGVHILANEKFAFVPSDNMGLNDI